MAIMMMPVATWATITARTVIQNCLLLKTVSSLYSTLTGGP